MHMWLWFGYNVGDFLFKGLTVVTRSAFAGTWIVLFVVAFLFEGSKVLVARAQRDASRKLYPQKRSGERRNLLWETPGQSETGTPGPSQVAAGQQAATLSARYRVLINLKQTALYLLHNTVGYLLMLAVMLYNLHLLLAVTLGMMLGYFVFGPMLTRMQTECFQVTKGPYCTPDCDDSAEGTTPPLLHTSLSSESDFFVCQTQSCQRRPPHYYPSSSRSNNQPPSVCYYGAKGCPSKVAVAKRRQSEAGPSNCHQDDAQNVEEQLLQAEMTQCLTPEQPMIVMTQEPPDVSGPQETGCSKETLRKQCQEQSFLDTGHEGCHGEVSECPIVSCCHNTSNDSLEKMVSP